MYANLDAEQAVITVLLFSPYLYEQVDLRPEDFTNSTLRTTFEIIGELRAKDSEVDLITVSSRIGTVDAEWLRSIIREDVTPDALPDYIDAVQRAKVKDDLEKFFIQGQAIVRGGNDIPTTELVTRVAEKLEDVRQVTPSSHSLEQIADEMLEKIDEIFDNPNETYGLATGIRDIDAVTFGLVKGEMTIYAGKPGVGKSALAAQSACEVALKHHKKALVFSLEMTAPEYLLRMVSQQCQLDTRKLKTRQYKKNGAEHNAILRMTDLIKRSPLKIIDVMPQTISTIGGEIAKEVAGGELGMFVVDYADLVVEPIRDEIARIKYIMRSLKNICRKNEVPGIVLAAISRDESQSGAQRLRYAGDYEGDIVALLEVDPKRTDDYAEIGIVKHRNGKTARIPLSFHAETTTWRDLVKGA